MLYHGHGIVRDYQEKVMKMLIILKKGDVFEIQ
jgi:hypothetical protein